MRFAQARGLSAVRREPRAGARRGGDRARAIDRAAFETKLAKPRRCRARRMAARTGSGAARHAPLRGVLGSRAVSVGSAALRPASLPADERCARADRGHRHRLRRSGHRRRLRRAGQRGVVRGHRRRQDRASARGEVPIYEPGLEELLARNAARLHFSTELADALEHARLLFVAVGTPPTHSGDADLSAVHAVVEAMPGLRRARALVMKSTVPCGTGATHAARLARTGQGRPGLRLLPGVPQGGLGGQGLHAPRPRRRGRRGRLGGRGRGRAVRAARDARRSCAPTSPARR